MITAHEIVKGNVSGEHYADCTIHPIQFGMANQLDACAYSILKYTTRHREKHGEVDLKKAIHFIELREVLATVVHQVTDWKITPEDYCRDNRLPVLETAVIIGLGLWLQTGLQHYADEMKNVLHEILSTYGSTTI